MQSLLFVCLNKHDFFISLLCSTSTHTSTTTGWNAGRQVGFGAFPRSYPRPVVHNTVEFAWKYLKEPFACKKKTISQLWANPKHIDISFQCNQVIRIPDTMLQRRHTAPSCRQNKT